MRMELLLCMVLSRERNLSEGEGAWKNDALRTQFKVQRSCWLTCCPAKMHLQRESNQEEALSECTGCGLLQRTKLSKAK